MYEHKTKGTEADETAKQVGTGQAEFEPRMHRLEGDLLKLSSDLRGHVVGCASPPPKKPISFRGVAISVKTRL